MSGTLKRLLGHPLTRGRSLDDPELTSLRRALVRGKPFLRAVYEDWYRWIAGSVPGGAGAVLELGSGGGFLADTIPDLITSEVFRCGGIRAVMDARRLPFRDGSLRAIVMTDVLHHVPDAGAFLGEAARVLRRGGALLMVEPWNTPLARLVWTHLHHEPFEPGAEGWGFPSSGPLSGANTALPWMIFARDRDRFERTFPDLAVARIEPCMPFRYLLSGGVSLRSLQPGWTTRAWRAVEALLAPWMDRLAMFARIEVRRR